MGWRALTFVMLIVASQYPQFFISFFVFTLRLNGEFQLEISSNFETFRETFTWFSQLWFSTWDNKKFGDSIDVVVTF